MDRETEKTDVKKKREKIKARSITARWEELFQKKWEPEKYERLQRMIKAALEEWDSSTMRTVIERVWQWKDISAQVREQPGGCLTVAKTYELYDGAVEMPRNVVSTVSQKHYAKMLKIMNKIGFLYRAKKPFNPGSCYAYYICTEGPLTEKQEKMCYPKIVFGAEEKKSYQAFLNKLLMYKWKRCIITLPVSGIKVWSSMKIGTARLDSGWRARYIESKGYDLKYWKKSYKDLLLQDIKHKKKRDFKTRIRPGPVKKEKWDEMNYNDRFILALAAGLRNPWRAAEQKNAWVRINRYRE